ncbi:MAG: cysteine-rich KTR domain-containing protein [Lachnospiraceae bacterium]|nr:cysteine-rich KTR domain-containing protein [Lachnospiraceae bacterium]
MEERREKPLRIHCPICKTKTRTRVYFDTVMVNYPLYCPKCKREILIDVVRFKMVAHIDS